MGNYRFRSDVVEGVDISQAFVYQDTDDGGTTDTTVCLLDVLNQLEASVKERNDRLETITQAGVYLMESNISILTEDTYDERYDKGSIPQYMGYDYLVKIANSSQDSHRVEQYAALALNKGLGLSSRALPVVADGNVNRKVADIIITQPSSPELADLGCKDRKHPVTGERVMQVAVEVKRAFGRNAILGLPLGAHNLAGVSPLDETGEDIFCLAGFQEMPQWLWVDSVAAWTSKQKYHQRIGVPLIGAIVACNIGELSDEDFSALGLVFLPATQWQKATAHNSYKGTTYTAYKAYDRRGEIQPLENIRLLGLKTNV